MTEYIQVKKIMFAGLIWTEELYGGEIRQVAKVGGQQRGTVFFSILKRKERYLIKTTLPIPLTEEEQNMFDALKRAEVLHPRNVIFRCDTVEDAKKKAKKMYRRFLANIASTKILY